MPIAPLPETTAQIVGSATVAFQAPIVVTDATFNGLPNASGVASRVSFPSRQLGSVRVQLLHYPLYRTRAAGVPGALASSWVARPYLMYRVLGVAPPYSPPTLPGFVQFVNAYTPLTPQLMLPVGMPVVHDFSGCGFNFVWVEFDTTAGTAGSNQGADLVLVTLTGSV